MLTGLPPFYNEDREKLFNNIKFAELKYPPYISHQCQDLLCKLFNKDPNKRLGGSEKDASEIMEHPWFSKVDWVALENKAIKPLFTPQISAEEETKYFDPTFTNQPTTDSFQEQGIAPVENKWEKFSYGADKEKKPEE